MRYSSENKKSGLLLGENNNALTWLITINATFFALIAMLRLVYFFADYSETQYIQQVVNIFSLPSSFSEFITQPWSLFTYMFAERSVWALVISLLWLWAFGFILQDMSGNKKLIPLYLYGGIAGALSFLLCYNLIPGIINNTDKETFLIGAGPSVMAIAVATTTLSPQYRLFPMLNGGIPLWIITVVYAAISVGLTADNGALLIANIFAAVVGYFYIKQYNKGRDLGAWMYRLVHRVDSWFNPDRKLAATPNSEIHFYKATTKPFEKKVNNSQQKLDDILDKINQKGYERLTEEEKEFLKKISQEENI